MVVVAKDTGVRAAPVSPGVNVSIEPLIPAQLPDLFVFRPDLERAQIEERIALGHLCFAAWHEGRIVHAGWAATGWAHVPYIHSDVVLGQDEFYIYDSYTLAAFRRSNLVIARSEAMHAHFRSLGFRKSYGVVALINRGGLAVLGPAGCREIGMYGCVRLGPLYHAWAYPSSTEPLPRLRRHNQS